MIEPNRKYGWRDDSALLRTCRTESGLRLPIMEAIAQVPLVLDAGLGTRLVERGLDLGCDDPSLWNLTRPALVHAIHDRDVAAGSDAVLTNTFGANRCWLKKFAQDDAVESINRQAVQLARRAAGSLRYVIGDIGPAAALEPGAAAEQAAVLVDSGVDALLFETYRCPDVESVLGEVTRSLAGPTPLLVSLWQWPEPAAVAARRLLDLGAAVIGMNCQPGIAAAIAFAERHGSTARVPFADQAQHAWDSLHRRLPQLVRRSDTETRRLQRASRGGLLRNVRGPCGGAGRRLRRLDRRTVPSPHGELR